MNQRHKLTQRRFQRANAERRFVECAFLVGAVVRRVVGGDEVYDAVAQALYHRVHIRLLAQGRVDLGGGIVGGGRKRRVSPGAVNAIGSPAKNRLVGQREVVRSNLRGYIHHALLLGAAHQFQRARCAQVRHMIASSGEPGQVDVAGNHDVLGGVGDALYAQTIGYPALVHRAAVEQLRLFAVVDDGQAHRGAVAERLAHDIGIGDRVAVVAEAHCARLGEFAHLR